MDELDMPSYASWIYQEGALSEPPLHKKKGSLPSDSALTFCILHFTSGFLIFLVYVLCLVVQSCPTLSDPMDCSLLGSSNHGIFQARVLEWGAKPPGKPLIAYTEF